MARTVFGSTALGWGHLSIDREGISWDNSLSYCPLCLAGGYHGYFHESNWLRKCPIHCIDLTRGFIPYSTDQKFDRDVRKLASLLDLGEPGWEIAEGKYLLKSSINKLPVFQKFLDWHKTAQKSVSQWSGACLGVLGHNCLVFHRDNRYQFRHLDLLIGRLCWITPLPRQITELFVASPLCLEPEVQHYDKELAYELHVILSKYPIIELLYLYKYANYVEGGSRYFQKTAETAIGMFNSQHLPKNCKCIWGIGHSGGWQHFKSGAVHEFWPYKCPYEFAATELYGEWLDLLPETKVQRNRTLEVYDRLAYAVAGTGIASVVGRAPGKTKYGSSVYMRPILKFHWSAQLDGLVDDVLAKVVMSQVNELKHWLLAIEAGISPDCRDRFPPNIYLVQQGGAGMQLVSWPSTGSNVSFVSAA